jgi:hypothetical protein
MMFIYVFFAMFITDVCWTFYLINVEERKSFAAGVWAMFLYMFGAFVVSSYVDDKALIIAAALGSFAGTFATIEFKKWKEKKGKVNNDFNDHPKER